MMTKQVNKEQVLYAYKKLQSVVRQTPLQFDPYLSEKYAANIYLKREDLQVVRSFKLRGAYFAISELTAEALSHGVICASAGNHAQGVAYACNEKQVMATIFMPNTTPAQKINQVRYFGGAYVDIVIEGDTFDACNEAAHVYAEDNHLTFIEPYDDEDVIAGQGSLAVEVHQSLTAEGETADFVFVPIGGGGLVSGVSAYMSEAMPETKIVGVEPSGAASMQLALAEGQPTALDHVDKFADGTAVGKAGNITFEYVQHLIDHIEIVPEGKIAGTIIDLYTRQAIVAEPSGALSVAALENMKEAIKGKTVVCIISGGNNDINRMAEIEERALIYSGKKQYFVVNFPQRPGALREFVSEVLGPEDDIAKFEYTKKISRSNGPALVGILLGEYETLPDLLERLEKFDPNYVSVSENPTLYGFLV